ncbi:hydrophobin-315 [Mycena leptocephala]|nr:hydrophobin-315 [Mycena leptocephala]
MFFKLSVVVSSMLIGLAAATGTPTNLCCASTTSTTSVIGSAIVALLSLNLSGITGSLGLNCSPITVIGNNCGGTAVTCTAPEAQCGLVAIGCVPITL